VKQAGRKAAARSKRVKKPTRYAAAPSKVASEFELLHAAHRGRMGVAIAASAADQLRAVAQVMGLAGDTALRRASVPAKVARAMSAADEMLEAQIGQLDQLANEPPFGPVSVIEILRRTAALIEASDDGTIEINIVPASRLSPVRASALDLAEILFALLRNAAEALRKSGGKITLSTGQDAESVRIVVEDDGPGLPAVLRSQLFQPFVRPRTGASHLGIGLSVARELARRNGGELTYDRRAAKGARFVVMIPRWISPRVGRSAAGR
jgi:signal transduction histidine kinase